MYDLQAKKMVHQFDDQDLDTFYSIALTPDDRYVILGQRKSLTILDLRNKQIYHKFEKVHKGSVYSVATTPDGRFIISGAEDGSIKFSNLKQRKKSIISKKYMPARFVS